MSDLYGAPSGISAAEADMRANQLAKLTLAGGEIKLQAATIELAQKTKMMEMMSQQKSSMGADLPSQMDTLAQMAMQSGMPEKAANYARVGSELRNTSSTLEKNSMEGAIKKLNVMGSLLTDVHDDVSWKRANAIYTMETGEQSPYAKMPYNPRIVDQLKMGVSTAKDRAMTAAAQARVKSSEASAAESRSRIPLIKAQTEQAEARTRKLDKEGTIGKQAKAEDIRAITDLATVDYGATLYPEDMRVIARPIAERMLQLMQSQNLTKSQAASRAYQESKESGDWGGITPRKQRSGTVQEPMDIPAEKGALKQNKFYRGKGKYEGQTLLWTGKNFQVLDEKNADTGADDEELDEGVDDEEGDE